MRSMPIQVNQGLSGLPRLKAAWRKNRVHYVQEGLGLGIFMASACFFGAMLFSPASSWYPRIGDESVRNVLMGGAMGLTALFIFYSPLTAPSGAQINPAVSIAYLRLGKMCKYDTFFFILFQTAGGTLSVLVMRVLMGRVLTEAPVYSVVTVPGKYGMAGAALTEFVIAFITMMMVLACSGHSALNKYTRIFASCLVCLWVVVAGPISGFGMNPARSFASAFTAHIWTSFWIYILMPLAGMLMSAEVFSRFSVRKVEKQVNVLV